MPLSSNMLILAAEKDLVTQIAIGGVGIVILGVVATVVVGLVARRNAGVVRFAVSLVVLFPGSN